MVLDDEAHAKGLERGGEDRVAEERAHARVTENLDVLQEDARGVSSRSGGRRGEKEKQEGRGEGGRKEEGEGTHESVAQRHPHLREAHRDEERRRERDEEDLEHLLVLLGELCEAGSSASSSRRRAPRARSRRGAGRGV